MGGLREIVQDSQTILLGDVEDGAREVIGEKGGCEGGDKSGTGAETGLVSFTEGGIVGEEVGVGGRRGTFVRVVGL